MRPLYSGKSKDQISCHTKALHVAPIADRRGQILQIDLQNRFGANTTKESASYILETSLESSRTRLGIAEDDSTSLSKLTLKANYILKTKSGTVLKRGLSRSVNNFNVLESPYASLVAEKGAEKRALRQIAYEIHQRLSVFFETHQSSYLSCQKAD
ncbi:MAG: LPS assembly lipoprotein LptE [Alphaproteobacteria bacterium]